MDISGQTVDTVGWKVGKPKTFKPQVTNQVNSYSHVNVHSYCGSRAKSSNPELSLSFYSPVALIFKPVTNLLLCVGTNDYECNLE